MKLHTAGRRRPTTEHSQPTGKSRHRHRHYVLQALRQQTGKRVSGTAGWQRLTHTRTATKKGGRKHKARQKRGVLFYKTNTIIQRSLANNKKGENYNEIRWIRVQCRHVQPQAKSDKYNSVWRVGARGGEAIAWQTVKQSTALIGTQLCSVVKKVQKCDRPDSPADMPTDK